MNSWPSDFTAPASPACLEIGGKKFENIPSNILKGATWIEDLAFDPSVQSIGRNAFENCTALSSIMFPHQLTQIGSAAFKGCTAIKELTLPEQLKSIASEAFQNCSELHCITLPQSLSGIDSYAFSGTAISSILFPDSLTHLGDNVFLDCPLENICYKNKWQDAVIGKTCFVGDHCGSHAGDPSIENLIVLNGTTHISENVFSNCTNLKTITFPTSLKSVGIGAFDGCSSLERINYGNQKNVQNLLFDTIENGKVIGKTVFTTTTRYTSNISITNVIILNNVNNIAREAFHCCSSIRAVTLPNSLTSIGVWAFDRCPLLKSIIIPDSVTTILDEAFIGDSSLNFVKLPKSLISVGYQAFHVCPLSLVPTIEFPDSLQSLGTRSFGGCQFQIITLPASLTGIGESALTNCKNLNMSKITLDVTNSINWSNAFGGQAALNQITKVTCRQEQVEKVQDTFPNATLEIVD